MYKFSASYISKQCEKIRFGSKVVTEEALGEAAKKLVDDFMQKPFPDEYVAARLVILTWRYIRWCQDLTNPFWSPEVKK